MSDRHATDVRRDCDLLAAYEMGLLSADQQSRFEHHLPDCPDCLDELYALAPATLEMTANPHPYAQAAKQALNSRRTRRPSPLSRLAALLQLRGPARLLVPVAVAAIVALAIVWPFSGGPSDVQRLANLDAIPYAQIQLRTGAPDATQVLFEDGMLSYQEQDYAQAAKMLALAITTVGPVDPVDQPSNRPLDQAHLYLGVSLLLAQKPLAAIEPLQIAVKSPLRPVADRAAWTLAQAYLASDQPKSAQSTLAQLAQSPVYREKAQHLLELIDRILAD